MNLFDWLFRITVAPLTSAQADYVTLTRAEINRRVNQHKHKRTRKSARK